MKHLSKKHLGANCAFSPIILLLCKKRAVIPIGFTQYGHKNSQIKDEILHSDCFISTVCLLRYRAKTIKKCVTSNMYGLHYYLEAMPLVGSSAIIYRLIHHEHEITGNFNEESVFQLLDKHSIASINCSERSRRSTA